MPVIKLLDEIRQIQSFIYVFASFTSGPKGLLMQCVYTFVMSHGYLNDLQTQVLKKHQDSSTYIKEKTKKQSKWFLPQYEISNI